MTPDERIKEAVIDAVNEVDVMVRLQAVRPVTSVVLKDMVSLAVTRAMRIVLEEVAPKPPPITPDDLPPLSYGCPLKSSVWGSDEYKCPDCGMQWALDEDRPACPNKLRVK